MPWDSRGGGGGGGGGEKTSKQVGRPSALSRPALSPVATAWAVFIVAVSNLYTRIHCFPSLVLFHYMFSTDERDCQGAQREEWNKRRLQRSDALPARWQALASTFASSAPDPPRTALQGAATAAALLKRRRLFWKMFLCPCPSLTSSTASQTSAAAGRLLLRNVSSSLAR